MSKRISDTSPRKQEPGRADINGTRAAIKRGDAKGVARAIVARFPKTMARLAK